MKKLVYLWSCFVLITLGLCFFFQVKNGKIINKIFINQNEVRRAKQSRIFEIQELINKYPCSNTDRNEKKASVICDYQSKIVNLLGIYDEHNCLKMSKESLHLARLYINTIKLSITNAIYIYFDGLIDGSQWPPAGTGQAITMTGIRRIDNLQFILEDIIERELDGDFIELGVWKGGLCILATSIFHAYKQYNRKVFLADSFDGIPPVNTKDFPADAAHVDAHTLQILSNKYTGGQEAVIKNFNLYFNMQTNRRLINQDIFTAKASTLLDVDPVEKEFNVKIEFLKGFFDKTLPIAIQQNRFRCFSVLRLDGDIYQSTWESLEYLYPYLNEEGIVIIDDFMDWEGSFKAVHDFRDKYTITTPIIQVFHGENEKLRGAYFMKPKNKNPPAKCMAKYQS